MDEYEITLKKEVLGELAAAIQAKCVRIKLRNENQGNGVDEDCKKIYESLLGVNNKILLADAKELDEVKNILINAQKILDDKEG